ncbi:MAG: LOG family protein, partial [Coprococcus sp.]
MNICIYGASSNDIDPSYIEAVRKLGTMMAERGHTLVFGAGGQGLMGAAARGVSSKNGHIIGVAPSFFDVDGILYENDMELIKTDTMRERKQIMEDRSDAFIM